MKELNRSAAWIAATVALVTIFSCLLSPAPACAQGQTAADIPKSYKRVVHKIGETSKRHIIGNRESISKTPHPYSEKSFSNRQHQEQVSSDLKSRHDEAFVCTTEVTAPETAQTTTNAPAITAPADPQVAPQAAVQPAADGK